MTEIFMAAIVVGATTLLGYSFSQNLLNRRKTLQRLIESFEKMKTYIEFSSKEILEITADVFGCIEGFEAFAETPRKDVTFVQWWENCVTALKQSVGLLKEDKELLIRFSNGIGVSDVAGQISHLNLYTELFSDKLRLASEAETKKSRLYKILGFSLGCAVTLIIV